MSAWVCCAESPGKFISASSCGSSSCHGGGGVKQNEFLIWSLRDVHSQRPPATLTSARSKQIGDALNIQDPSTDARCTSCHAPLATVPGNQRGGNLQVSEGVSCECCHGPAEKWLRSHTRIDYTRTDRVAAGMSDLQNLYVRANTCVACHQVVSQPILQAGHPELIFELDGQSVAEPKHWTAEKNGNSAQAWFVGQAVALREMSWHLAHQETQTANEINRWLGLLWVVQRAGNDPLFPPGPVVASHPTQADFAAVQHWADSLAMSSANIAWPTKLSELILGSLAKSSVDYQQAVPPGVLARRAERVVLALDRLLAAENNLKADPELDQLFKLVQSVPEFDPKKFAAALSDFSRALGEH
jgi:hypothetical protein